MVRVSNALIGFLNLIILIASLSLVGISLYLRFNGHTECHKLVQNVLLIFGVSLFVVSVLGMCGACCRVNALLWIYLFVLSLLMIVILSATVFAFVVTNQGAGKAVSGRGFKEYRLGDYSNWLQNHVVNAENWDKFKSCLTETPICSKLGEKVQKADAFNKQQLSPIQAGCCKPPTYCGLTFKNATYWEVPKTGPAVPDSDCLTWNNNQQILCYDCKSCKAGLLANIKTDWKKIAIFNISIFLLLSIVHCVGSCAYHGNKNDRYKGYRGGYY